MPLQSNQAMCHRTAFSMALQLHPSIVKIGFVLAIVCGFLLAVLLDSYGATDSPEIPYPKPNNLSDAHRCTKPPYLNRSVV